MYMNKKNVVDDSVLKACNSHKKLTCYTVGKTAVLDLLQRPLEIWNDFHKLYAYDDIL